MKRPVEDNLSEQTKRRLLKLIHTHVTAELDYSWSGSGDPDFVPQYEEHAKEAKRTLYNFVREL